jgi:sugar phosphate isomerase/epimerase
LAWKKEEDLLVRDLLLEQKIYNIDIVPLHVVETLETISDSHKNYKRFWSDVGIEILGMQSLFYERRETLFFSDKKTVKETLAYFERVSELAYSLGCRSLVFGSPKQRNLSADSVSIEEIKIFFKEMSKICKKYDQIVCLEPNSNLYGTNFLTSTREVAEFIDLLADDNIRMNFDTGCDLMNGEDPVRSFEEFGHYVQHVHISAPQLKRIDEFTLDHKNFSRILKKSNYSGGVSIEMLRDEKDSIGSIRNAVRLFNSYH